MWTRQIYKLGLEDCRQTNIPFTRLICLFRKRLYFSKLKYKKVRQVYFCILRCHCVNFECDIEPKKYKRKGAVTL